MDFKHIMVSTSQTLCCPHPKHTLVSTSQTHVGVHIPNTNLQSNLAGLLSQSNFGSFVVTIKFWEVCCHKQILAGLLSHSYFSTISKETHGLWNRVRRQKQLSWPTCWLKIKSLFMRKAKSIISSWLSESLFFQLHNYTPYKSTSSSLLTKFLFFKLHCLHIS